MRDERKIKMLERERNYKQEVLIMFLKSNLTEEKFNISLDYIEELEIICNKIIGNLRN